MHSIDAAESDCSATFSLFPKLPAELRLRIWKHSLPGTRIVPVHCGADELVVDSSVGLVAAIGCTTTIPNPTNLNICTESRAEAIKSYRRCFGFVGQPGHIYFDPSRDVLYFGPRQGCMAAHAQFRTCMALCDSSELAAVRRIAISDALFWIGDAYRSTAAASLTIDVLRIVSQCLPNLQELVFVPREEDEARRDDLDHILPRMHGQVNAAIDALTQLHAVAWKVPVWRVTTLRALHDTAG
ncbi:hypothetical protein ISF_08748 [Cordyceps fumosorosea ARSEF 2679]|uniref:2EXR domain-containing protein n=1 Tax=Cordyceps fumosorosea (strain ARSEF 2679) TaxID=1081104 RepID=A0A162I7J9_CORFA|nr:hypothetical protein ISF_08748 [Cordyceps fumosorosea ARSEF 2679]OAA53395.1 hypothetical protein ISF_08748 [Cordyceps fumosorosea ARSEF 2679]